MRKFLGVALAAIIAAGATTAAHAADKLALVLSTLNNPFFVTLKDGAATKAKQLGYDLVVLDSQNDPAKELSNVEDVLNQNVKLVMLNPANSDAAKSSVLAANHKNVPVITLDRSANGGDVVTHIASDNVAGGRMAADLVIKKLGGKGNVVELEGVPGASAARDRGKGFGDEIATAPGIKIIVSQTANFDRTQGLNVMENILQAQPNIDAVFAQNDEMALGAVKAIQAAQPQDDRGRLRCDGRRRRGGQGGHDVRHDRAATRNDRKPRRRGGRQSPQGPERAEVHRRSVAGGRRRLRPPSVAGRLRRLRAAGDRIPISSKERTWSRDRHRQSPRAAASTSTSPPSASACRVPAKQ